MVMRTWPRLRLVAFPLSCGQVQVYRRADRLVHGPCMSLYVGEVELGRWDLPAGQPHVHWAIQDAPRLYLPRHWPTGQLVELACDQLRQHSRVMARLCGLARPGRQELAEAAEWAGSRLLERA